MRVLILIALALVACAPATPEERGIPLVDCETPGCDPYDSDIYKVYNQDKAMLLFEKMVEDHFDRKLGDVRKDTTVWWTTTTCPYSDEPAVIHNGVCSHGKMWSCQEMYVALPVAGKTCGSALLHEFAHCLTMHLAGGSWADAGHNGEIWEIVGEASRIACDRGW